MNKINCPECGKVFKIDETGYSNILKQVRDGEFEEEVSQRLLLAEKDKIQSIELAKKDIKIQMQKYVTTKNTEIQSLQAKISAVAAEKTLEVAAAKSSIEKERDTLAYQLEKRDKVLCLDLLLWAYFFPFLKKPNLHLIQ